jgi:acetate kinase
MRSNQLKIVGHRIVHGGPRLATPTVITTRVLRELQALEAYAPEHLPSEILLIREFGGRHPELVQVACFDTGFHRTLPRTTALLPIPRRYFEKGIRRYGFHGLSYEYLIGELARTAGEKAARGRVVLAHLGNGASMTATHDGRSVDTSMAFTPAAGLVMSTRAGDLDPGLAAFLAHTEGLTSDELYEMFHAQSGLLGISETTSDMRDLLERQAMDERAADAVEVFCLQARKFLGAYAAELGGLDTLVFSGGIGENAPEIRRRICQGLEFLGITLEQARNQANAPLISADQGQVAVRVIETDEALQIARLVKNHIKGNS